MKKEIKKERLKVFIEHARIIDKSEQSEIPWEKLEAVVGKSGLWLEVVCPDGACSVENDRITLPAGGVVSEETKGIWLSLFCPENQCMIEQFTDLP